MRKRSWLVVLGLLVTGIFLAAGMAEETGGKPAAAPPAPEPVKPLRLIGSFDAPPFSYKEAGRKVGFEVELAEAIGKVLGRPVVWMERPFNIPALASDIKTGRADAVLAAMTVTEERKEYFLFTIPYYRSSLAVATYRDVDWDHRAFTEGLSRAVRAGVLRRTTGEGWARKNLQATLETYDSPQRLARSLNDREVELILVDEPILRWELARRHYKFNVVEQNLDREDYAFAVSRSRPELVEELNRALRKLEADGTYGEIHRKWYDATGKLPAIGR